MHQTKEKLFETKLYSRNLIKELMGGPHCKIHGTILKMDTGETQTNGQESWLNTTLYIREMTKTDYMCQEKKEKAGEFSFEKISYSSNIPFSYFFLLCLFDGVCFQYSQALVIFLFFKGSNVLLTWLFYFFHWFSFSFFIMSMANSVPIYWMYIIFVCIGIFSSFSTFANTFIWSMCIIWLIFSCALESLWPVHPPFIPK